MATPGAAAWADAQKYMSPEEIARLSKVISPDGQYNPGAGTQWDVGEAVKKFQGLDDAGRGNFVNQWDQASLAGNAPSNAGAALQQALRNSMGKENFDNWYAGVQNRQAGNIMPGGGGAPPNPMAPTGPGTAPGMKKIAMEPGEPGGGAAPGATGTPLAKGPLVAPPSRGAAPAPGGGGNPIIEYLLRSMGAHPGARFPNSPGPTPFGGGSRGAAPGAPGSPGGGAASPYPATWNGLPPRAFDPSWLLQSMRAKFGSGGGAGQVFSPGNSRPGWTSNAQYGWNNVYGKK